MDYSCSNGISSVGCSSLKSNEWSYLSLIDLSNSKNIKTTIKYPIKVVNFYRSHTGFILKNYFWVLSIDSQMNVK